jgi:hypothetical protein
MILMAYLDQNAKDFIIQFKCHSTNEAKAIL